MDDFASHSVMKCNTHIDVSALDPRLPLSPFRSPKIRSHLCDIEFAIFIIMIH